MINAIIDFSFCSKRQIDDYIAYVKIPRIIMPVDDSIFGKVDIEIPLSEVAHIHYDNN